MELMEFCRGIDLMDGAVERINSLPIDEKEYEQYRALCQKDYFAFCSEIRKREGHRGWLLAYLCRFACEVYEVYKEKGIDEKIYWDTFRDIRHWCENCYNEFGEYGIDEYTWFWRHLTLRIVKLGRLQFETIQSEWDAAGRVDGGEYRIRKGEPAINIHIPQGEPLTRTACLSSLEQAYKRFGDDIQYVCLSWLLDPELKNLLKPDSNILEFQKNFAVIETEKGEHEAERFIFGRICLNPKDYPADTSLQRAAKEYLLSGNNLGNGLGILKKHLYFED